MIQSTPIPGFSSGFTEDSVSQLNGQKHLRPVAEDFLSNKQKRAKRIYKENSESKDIIKLSSQYFSTGHNFVWFLLGVWK